MHLLECSECKRANICVSRHLRRRPVIIDKERTMKRAAEETDTDSHSAKRIRLDAVPKESDASFDDLNNDCLV